MKTAGAKGRSPCTRPAKVGTMMNITRLGLKGFGLGLALLLSTAVPPQASASPLGSAIHLEGAASLPLVDVQARRYQRPVRNTARRNRNNAALAGALVGAAIIGGAIIANSQAQRREERRRQSYYYGQPQYDRGQPEYGYGEPRRVYRQPSQYYYQAPGYDEPQQRVRRSGRTCIVNTPDRETPYTYVPC
ncbi:MAG: hypothetical protein IOC58_02930 [Methylobacterium sp.]|nr:hypothetical protein [Methylobacterium sp.]MCA3605546.1 hypothetical protein [Methylobacterium sp.]MCA3609011.1 hypothetical protein [Methylobacterium sp.]MCA3622474.1 hypothetical protein [Methylobacterium sp.]